MQSTIALRQTSFTPLVARPAKASLRRRQVAAHAVDTSLVISGELPLVQF